MIALIQRVSRAEVRVDQRIVGTMGAGILALVGIRRGDDAHSAERLLERILAYRIFADAEAKMHLSLRDTGGGLLLVPQFTLAADTRQGTRAGFSNAASPDEARRLFDHLIDQARIAHSPVATGEFGAHMQVSSTNDGPVTFWLESGRLHSS